MLLLSLHWFGCRKGRPTDKSGSSDAQTSPEPSVSHGANSILVQASSAVEMRTSPAQGRFLQVGNMHGHFLGVGNFRQKMMFPWCHCTWNCVLFECAWWRIWLRCACLLHTRKIPWWFTVKEIWPWVSLYICSRMFSLLDLITGWRWPDVRFKFRASELHCIWCDFDNWLWLAVVAVN